jgi:hypothetical protein
MVSEKHYLTPLFEPSSVANMLGAQYAGAL